MRSAWLVLLFILFCNSPAHALRLSVVGAVNSSEPKELGEQYKGVPALGGGLLAEFRMVPMLGLEFGALYMPRRFEREIEIPVTAKITTEGKMYEFPVLLRAHLGGFLSLGVGGYYATATGHVQREVQAGASTTGSRYSYAEAQQTTSDFGLATSLALHIHMAPLTYFLLDGRYTMGMKNNSTAPGGDRKYNDMQLLAGIQFGY